MRKRIIALLYQHKALRWMLALFHRAIGQNRFKQVRGNQIKLSTGNLYRNTFAFRNQGNSITIGAATDLQNSTITIKGANNRIVIGKNGFLNGLCIILEGNDNRVFIGDHAFVLDDTRIYVVDGSSFKMGDNCMFSDHIDIRTTDNHSIIDRASGKRINYEEDVILHDKVWLCTGVRVLKGAELADGCIVGAGTVVTRKHLVPNSVVVGNPGREVSGNVDWRMERIR